MEKETIMGGIVLILLAVFLVSGLSGCGDRTYEQPNKTTPGTGPSQVETFKVGETATDGELKVTLNSVRYTTKIDEQNNEFMIAEADEGKQWVIIDLIVENVLSAETQAISTFLNTEISDSEGYTYHLSFEGTIALDKQFKDGDLLPRMKKRGELAYEVPIEAQDLKFVYRFDLLGGTTALFELD